MHNGSVKITTIRGGVNVWTGNGDVWVIYKNSREVGKHVFEVSGTVQTCNSFQDHGCNLNEKYGDPRDYDSVTVNRIIVF